MAEIIPAQLAKILNLKRQAVYMAIRRNNIDLNSGGMIDTTNQKNQQWLVAHGISEQTIISALAQIQENQKSKLKLKAPSNPIPKIREKSIDNPGAVEPEKIISIEKYIGNNKSSTIPINPNNPEVDFENITGLPARMMNMTIMELVTKYGGPMMLESWSKILQRLMGASLQDQKIQERRLELVEKDFIISRILQYLENQSIRLFDYAESAPIGFISTVQAGGENVEIEIKKKMRKDFSILIKESKESVTRELENLKKKYQKKNDSNE